MSYRGLDVQDNKILKILKDDARASYSEIAEQVGISRVAVKNRIQAMEERGIIQGYKAIINIQNANDGVSFILDINTAPNSLRGLVDVLGRKTMITKLHTVSGDCRIHAEGVAASIRELNEFTNRLFNDETYGVKNISFNVILSTHKDVDGGVDYVRKEDKEK